MPSREREYYYGSYGMIRGFGPLFRTLKEADDSVFEDGRKQRKNGGSTDRNAVLVESESGLCWWAEEGEPKDWDLMPVKTAQGVQARYPEGLLVGYRALLNEPTEIAGFS